MRCLRSRTTIGASRSGPCPLSHALSRVADHPRHSPSTRLTFTRLLLGAGHDAIVTELAERGMNREALTALADDAEGMEQAGKNVLLPAEATAREKAAVKAQSVRWNAIRRMVALACAGDGALSQRLSEC